VRVALIVTCAACGRIGFGALATHDGGNDALAAACDWSHGPAFSALHAYPELDSPQYEADPFLTPGDPLTMHFASFRTGTAHVYVAHRAAVGAAFDAPVELIDLNTTSGDEDSFYLDSARGYFSWTITDGVDPPAIYEIARSFNGGLVPGRRLTEIDDAGFAGDKYNAWPSPDGLELSFAAGVAPGYHIYFATRPDLSSMWSGFVEFGDSAAAAQPASGATLTANRLVIVWSQGTHGNAQLYYATRATPTDAFGPATRFPFSTVQNDDNTPQIRDDGCEMFFAHAPANGQWDLASVDVTP